MKHIRIHSFLPSAHLFNKYLLSQWEKVIGMIEARWPQRRRRKGQAGKTGKFVHGRSRVPQVLQEK